VTAATTAANDTTAYVGVAYAARGASITTAVKAAQIAATTNTDPQQQTAAVIKVKTAAQLAKSNVQITAPDVPLSTSIVQTVHVHAEDPGRLVVSFWRPQGERDWDLEEVDIKVTSVDGGPGSTCDHTLDSIGASGDVVRCDLPVGDHTVTYTLTSGPNVAAWKIIADTEFQIVNYGVGNPEATHSFSVTSPYPVRERYRFIGRDTTGRMFYYDGTGNAAAPYRDRWGFEYNWKSTRRQRPFRPWTCAVSATSSRATRAASCGTTRAPGTTTARSSTPAPRSAAAGTPTTPSSAPTT
jgi:hypothetical protein